MTIAGLSPGPVPVQPTPAPLTPTSAQTSGGLSFGDVLDAVNPLQHIPILSGLYRAATGTQISSVSEVAGDTLYGALLPGGAIAGLASSLADVAVKQVTGKDVGQLALGVISPSSSSTAPVPVAAPSASAAVVAATSHMLSMPFTAANHNAQVSNSQYQRAQAFDALNNRLVKMAV